MNRHITFIDHCKFALIMLSFAAPLIWMIAAYMNGESEVLVVFLAPVVGIGLCLAGMLALYICIAIVRIVYRELQTMFSE